MNYPGGSGAAPAGPPETELRGDPVMGDASWISCEIWGEGELAYMDHAFAGDGTDVNCLTSKS